ncbi:hypothetical protein [Sorangium sp. So ce388]|uniref:hypothetical protein n=1 Tax=Sorangium sp. So ce388 TaxID=3133309 RepID=UPI003F5C2B91
MTAVWTVVWKVDCALARRAAAPDAGSCAAAPGAAVPGADGGAAAPLCPTRAAAGVDKSSPVTFFGMVAACTPPRIGRAGRVCARTALEAELFCASGAAAWERASGTGARREAGGASGGGCQAHEA